MTDANRSHNNATLARQWIEDNRAGIDACVRRAVNAIEADRQFRVPVEVIGRPDAMDSWLTAWRDKLDPLLHEEWQRTFPAFAKHRQTEAIHGLVSQIIWPEVALYLKKVAIRAAAAAWCLRHVGDRVALGMPEKYRRGWRIPIGLRGSATSWNQIEIADDGTVRSDAKEVQRFLTARADGLKKPLLNLLEGLPTVETDVVGRK